MKTISLIGYARVSTETQRDNSSLPEQRAAIQSWCKEAGYRLITVLDDVESAENADSREGLQDALKMVRCGVADGLVVYLFDRLTRKVKDAEIIRNEFSEMGKLLLSVRDNVELEGADNVMFYQMKSVFAERERKRIKERCDFGRRRKIEAGEYRAGPPPYGYMVQSKQLIPLEREQEVLKLIFDLHTKQLYSPSMIAEVLNRRSIPSKRGGKWSVPVLYQILYRPVVCLDRLNMPRVLAPESSLPLPVVECN